MSGEPRGKQFSDKTGPVNLNVLASKAETFVESIGIIFDATGFYKTNRSFDYVIKLRVFDDTMDPATKESINGYEPYLMVFLYFQNREDIVRVPRIGDIIILQSFLITLNDFQDKVYITASSNQSCSDWQILDGAESASNIPILEKNQTGKRKYFYNEYYRVNTLRTFRKLWRMMMSPMRGTRTMSSRFWKYRKTIR